MSAGVLPCPFCGSYETLSVSAVRATGFHCLRCGSDGPVQASETTHWGKHYALGREQGRWMIWRQVAFVGSEAQGGTKGWKVDRSAPVESFPYGETGWREAWATFLRFEPRYLLKQRWDRWKPRVGVTAFWTVATVLLVAAVAAEGVIAVVLFVGLALYLVTFLVLALGESLPWNE